MPPDYADEILSKGIGKVKKSETDWADMLLDPTTTSKTAPPVQEPLEGYGLTNVHLKGRDLSVQAPQEAGFGAMVETGFVDDPETQMNILSKRMGIPRVRFGVVGGEIVYRDDFGNIQKAMPGKLKKMIAQEIPRAPSIVMGTIGAIGGPGTAALGAAGGEGIRRVVGKLAYEEPQTSLGNIKGMAVEGGLAYGGERLGGKLIKIIDRRKGKKAASLMRLSGAERLSLNPREIREIERLARKFDIDLFVPQTTGSRELIARFNLLGDLPVTADKIGKARLRQYGQINKAVNEWLNTFAEASVSPGESGRRAVEAAKGALRAPKKAARKASKALYEEAKNIRGVDVSDTVNAIEGLLEAAPKGGTESRSLNRIKNMITRKVTDPKGKTAIVPEDRISVLDKVKKEINSMWKKDFKSAPEIDAQRSINKILDGMLSNIDDQVPVYKEARRAYQESIRASGFEEISKSKIGQIAKLEGDKVENAARLIFSPSQSSPEIIDITKKAIIDNGGEDAWNALIRTHLKNKFREVARTNTQNIGGMLRKKLLTDIDQHETLRTAMNPEQYQTFTDFMKVLDRTGLTAGKESTTATRQVSLSQIQDEAAGLGGKITRAAAYPLYTWKRIIADFGLKLKAKAYQTMLADAMLDPANSIRFRQMLQLRPGSQKLLTQFSTFLTSLSGGTYLREKQEYKGVPIPPIRRRERSRRVSRGIVLPVHR